MSRGGGGGGKRPTPNDDDKAHASGAVSAVKMNLVRSPHIYSSELLFQTSNGTSSKRARREANLSGSTSTSNGSQGIVKGEDDEEMHDRDEDENSEDGEEGDERDEMDQLDSEDDTDGADGVSDAPEQTYTRLLIRIISPSAGQWWDRCDRKGQHHEFHVS